MIMRKNQNLTSCLKRFFILTVITFSFSKIKAPITCTNLTNYSTTRLISTSQNKLNENYDYSNNPNIPINYADEIREKFSEIPYNNIVTKRSEVSGKDIIDFEREILQEKNKLKKQKEISLIPKPPENERISDNIPIKNNLPQTSYENINIPKIKIPNNNASIKKTNIPNKLTKQKTTSKFNIPNKLTKQKTMSTNKNLQPHKSLKNLHNPEQKTLNKYNAHINNSGINKKRRTSSIGLSDKLINEKEKKYLEYMVDKNTKNTKMPPSKFGKSLKSNKNTIEKNPKRKLIRHSSVGNLLDKKREKIFNEESFIKKLDEDDFIHDMYYKDESNLDDLIISLDDEKI